MKNKRNLNRKWLLLQNDQNADTTLLHSHDELVYQFPIVLKKLQFLWICEIWGDFMKIWYFVNNCLIKVRI